MTSAKPILWLGGVFADEEVRVGRSISPAASRWQHGLLKGIAAAGGRVTVCGHMPERIWPYGQLRPRCRLHPDVAGADGLSLPYWNLPYLRERLLAVSYWRQISRLSEEVRQGVLMSYNVAPHIALVAQRAVRHCKTSI